MPIIVRSTLCLLLLLSVTGAHAGRFSDEKRQEKLKALDLACEQARVDVMLPKMKTIFKECMAKEQSREYCKNLALSYNADRVGGSPRHYDLPECVEAFEFRKQHRER